MQVRVGQFAPGFVPQASNYAQWGANFRALSHPQTLAPDTFAFVSSTSPDTGPWRMQQTAINLTPATAPVGLEANGQLYIWIANSTLAQTGTEAALLTYNEWKYIPPVAGPQLGVSLTLIGQNPTALIGSSLVGNHLDNSGEYGVRLVTAAIGGATANPPTITTTVPNGITANAASTGGNVTADGGGAVSERGVVYGIAPNPELGTALKAATTGTTGSFTVALSGLASGTTYFVRAFATNSAGTAYGNQQSFITGLPTINPPTVSTSSVTGVSSDGATAGGSVSNDGGGSILERGVVYSTSTNPSLGTGTVITTPGTTGIFAVSLSGLNADTTYYARAFARNSAGTSYGSQQSFTTSPPQINPPVVTTALVTGVTQNSASAGGMVSSDGGGAILERGVVYGTAPNPVLGTGTKRPATGSTGGFSVTLGTLSQSTTYYVRAFATNSVGTAYGVQQSFMTLSASANLSNLLLSSGSLTPPFTTATQTYAANVTGATSFLQITPTAQEPGATVQVRVNTGAFAAVVSGTESGPLSLNIGSNTVEVRVTAPGGAAQRTYTVNVSRSGPPIVNQPTATNVTSTTATLGGTVTSDSGAPIFERGVIYSPSETNSNPQLGGTEVTRIPVEGSTGKFAMDVPGLQTGLRYSARAYAVNAEGAGYSDVIAFLPQERDLSSGFVVIPGGSFTMGRTSGDTDSDAPPVAVTVSAFYLAETETTKARWDQVRAWGLANGYSDLPVGGGKGPEHPVHSVTWFAVVKWSNARSEMEGLTPVYTVGGAVMRTGTSSPDLNWSANGYRLPTEAEWEKAARGGSEGRRFPWGNEIDHSYANYRAYGSGYSYDTSPFTTRTYHPDFSTGEVPHTSPVGSFDANEFGVRDISGNVQEWCWDWYGADQYVSSNGTTDPKGPESGTKRLLKGGTWYHDAFSMRLAYRYNISPSYTDTTIGFRSARSHHMEDFTQIPGGSFTMGRTSGDADSNAPPVMVTVSSFFISKNETTKAQWDEVKGWGRINGYSDLPDGAGKASDHPVHSVNWFDVVKWCNARSEMEDLTPVYTVGGAVMRTGTTAPEANWTANGYRLPTEAEWERAARGGMIGKRFPWGGDEITHGEANYDSAAWAAIYDKSPTNGFHPTFDDGVWPRTSPVGRFAANGYGLNDMSGNVQEWCWDWYRADAYAAIQGSIDPRGPVTGTDRVRRGGSWGDNAVNSRCSTRNYTSGSPGDTNGGLGFRLAQSFGSATLFGPPLVKDPTFTNVTGIGATLGGNVIDDGGSAIVERGFVYSVSANNGEPEIGGADVTKVATSGTTGIFTVDVSELADGIIYSLRAYATNGSGTGYSNVATFKTLSSKALLSVLEISSGSLKPDFSSATTNYTAAVSRDVATVKLSPMTANAGATIEILINNSEPQPIASGSATDDLPISHGDNIVEIAVTSEDELSTVTYNVVITRQTKPRILAPNVKYVTGTLATLGAYVSSNGGADVIERGFLISESGSNPGASDLVLNGLNVTRIVATQNESVTFEEIASNLVNGTTYNFRGYAINSEGIGYSEIESFTTDTQVNFGVNGIGIVGNREIWRTAQTFRFTVPSPKSLSISAFGSRFLVGELFNANGELVASFNGEDSMSTIQPVPAGSYSMRITNQNDEPEQYTLFIDASLNIESAPRVTLSRSTLVSRKLRKVTGTASVRNLGNMPDELRVSATRGNGKFAVVYVSGGNVTAQVTAGRFQVGPLSATSSPISVRATVTPKRRSLFRKGNVVRRTFDLQFTASSVPQPSITHSARIRVLTR